MSPEYIKNYVERLRKENGNAFVEALYQYLKQEHQIEEAQLPPVPGRSIQLRPEHDIRSRMPRINSLDTP